MTRGVVGGGLVLTALAAVIHLWPRTPVAGTSSVVLPVADEPARPAGGAPEGPRVRVELPGTPAAGLVRVVVHGEDLQAVIDGAKPGDVIALEAGAVFTGPLRLPRKSGDDWITIRTSTPDGLLPPGARVGPAAAPLMPKIESATDAVLTAAPGAHHYRFIGIEIRPRAGAFLYNLVLLGSREKSLEELPHHLVFERCFVHGDAEVGARRGFAFNSRYTAVLDSHLADFKEEGADSQAILGWNGPGPFAIVNDYLEAAGENVMFGGGDPSIPDLVPSDIEVRANHFAKPLSWKRGEAGYQGTNWTVKNLFELKNARRVLVEGNVFENNWVQAQAGFAILFTVRNQDGGAPWAVVEDVSFMSNIVRHTAAGVNILGHDDNNPSQQTRRVLVRNNVFEDVGADRWGGGGQLLQVLERASDVTIDHNTAFQTGNILTADHGPHTGFVFQNNIVPHNAYGITGTGTAAGTRTLSAYFPDAVVRRNVIAGAPAAAYPQDNFFPASLGQVGFRGLAAGDYRLSPQSPYLGAGTDGRDVGVDGEELSRALAGAGAGLRATSRSDEASRSCRSVERTEGCAGGAGAAAGSVPAGKPGSMQTISNPASRTRAAWVEARSRFWKSRSEFSRRQDGSL